MPQLSKLIKARDKWREKATKRAEELWENRKIVKYYKKTLLQLREDNEKLEKELQNNNANNPTSNIINNAINNKKK